MDWRASHMLWDQTQLVQRSKDHPSNDKALSRFCSNKNRKAATCFTLLTVSHTDTWGKNPSICQEVTREKTPP